MSAVYIGKAAKEVGLSPRTIRFYEQAGLLAGLGRGHAGWSSAGYRVFSPTDLRRLQLIKHARECGMSLDDMRTLLGLAENGCCGLHHPEYRTFAEHKLVQVKERLAHLHALERSLTAALRTRVCNCQPVDEVCMCVLDGSRELTGLTFQVMESVK